MHYDNINGRHDNNNNIGIEYVWYIWYMEFLF